MGKGGMEKHVDLIMGEVSERVGVKDRSSEQFLELRAVFVSRLLVCWNSKWYRVIIVKDSHRAKVFVYIRHRKSAGNQQSLLGPIANSTST